MGALVVRRTRLVLIIAMLTLVGSRALGIGAFGKLRTGGFQDPAADG